MNENNGNRIRRFVFSLFLIATSSMVTLAAVSFFGLRTELVTIVPKGEAALYNEFREDYSYLLQLKSYIETNYYEPPNQDDLKLGIYKGLFAGLNDPYSQYMTEDEMETAMIHATGEYEGIGVSIVPDDQGYINVIAPIEDTPAEKIGIKAGDKILKIDDVEYNGSSIDAAVSKMRGTPGTSVKVTVLRGKDIIDFNITRASVVMKTVKHEILPDNIGYIRISSFDSSTAQDFKAALFEMENNKVDGLIVDVRGNPGGLVDQSVKVSSMLVGKEVIVYTQKRSGEREEETGTTAKTDLNYVLLIDNGSASASEILAGAVKDTKSGLLIGTTTYGKGIIQQMLPLDNGDGIKLTIAQYFSPNGNVIHKKGIAPDIEVEIKESDYNESGLPRENDRQLKRAINELKGL